MEPDNGFLLYKILLEFMLLIMVATVYLKFFGALSYSIAQMQDRLLVVDNMRYVRQVLTQYIRNENKEIVVSDEGQSIRFTDPQSTKFSFKNKQIYRVLSDGQHHPLSGYAIQGTSPQLWVQDGEIPAFQKDGCFIQVGFISKRNHAAYEVNFAALQDELYFRSEL